MNSPATEPPASGVTRERGFPVIPMSWFHLCSSRELDSGPNELELCGRSFVGYRTRSGKAVVLAGRCSHLGAKLANGTVVGERIACPLHGWEFGATGVCERIPVADAIPDFARQCSYPVEESGGQIFFFSHAQAAYPLPFFDGQKPDDLLPAKPFDLIAEAPWYLIGANGFDMQHFLLAHDRSLIGEPEVSSPSPFARRIAATFEVCGKSWRDRLTRLVAGPRVTMTVTDWCGSLILVRAELARTTTFGMLCAQPLDARRTRARVIVWVSRGSAITGGRWLAAINAWVRRSFIRTFLRSDLPRIAGMRYQPEHLIAADRVMADYFEWLQNVSKPSIQENT